MRVLWVTQVYPRDASDLFGLFLHRLARELASRGVSVRVVAPGAPGAAATEVLDGVEIRRFPYPGQDQSPLAYTGEMHRAARRHPVRFLRFVRAMLRACDREVHDFAPDLIHAHWWLPAGAVCRRRASRWNVPYVLSLHGTDVRLLTRTVVAWPLARWVLGGAGAVLPVSETLARELARLGLDGRVRDVIPMPADDDVFRPAPLAPGNASFVVAARLTAQKRIDVALRALGWARDQGTRAHLHVVGDGEERERLVGLARELGLSELVTFHGFLPQRALAEIFRASRAVVLTSRDEGYGLVLVEAALSGRASVGVRSGAIGELVIDGETGLLVEPGDHVALGAALVELAGNPARAEALGRRAREEASGRTAGPLAERLVRTYRADSCGTLIRCVRRCGLSRDADGRGAQGASRPPSSPSRGSRAAAWLRRER